MAYTFLQAVNSALKAAGDIQGSSGELTTFTDSARQQDIDVMIDSWNEVIRSWLRAGDIPQETAEGTLTLATDQSSYSFSSDMSITDFEFFAGNPIDTTNKNELTPYIGGWIALRSERPSRSDYSGLPYRYTLNTTNGNMELDATPNSDVNGRTYTFLYVKRINLSATTDTFPFSDSVVDELQLAVVEVYTKKRKDEFDEGFFAEGMATAAHLGSPVPKRTKYGVF